VTEAYGARRSEGLGLGACGLAPAAADPHIAAAMSCPVAAYPNGGGPGPNDPAATSPYPAAVPSPIARGPDIIGTRSDRNDLDPKRRRGRRGHNDCRRGRGHRLRRWHLRRHRSRGCRRSRPIGCGDCRRGRRLALVGNRRRIRLLDHVCRLNLVRRHVSNLPLRATGDQNRDTRERHARGQYFSIHGFKVLHIQPIGRKAKAANWIKMCENAE
jgi:hypothetical protein